MILIADSGSTKTDWQAGPEVCHTQGINPVLQDRETILRVLSDELLPQMARSGGVERVSSVFFYGSGVRPEMESLVEQLLREVFPCAEHVEAYSDMLGAARALLGRNEGISCILGTGANACLYDGEQMAQRAVSLGFILGDEGSGAALGKRFIHALYKGGLSKEILLDFECQTGLTLPDIIHKVYRQPMPNRFLASLSSYVHSRIDDMEVRAIVVDNFRDFFREYVAPFGRPDLPVSFVGSIAWYYQAELQEAAAACGFRLGTILQAPLEGLVRYHAL